MKILTLVLFAYVATAFSVRIPWDEVLLATFIPRLSWDRGYILMLVAVLGTTISPYHVFLAGLARSRGRRADAERRKKPRLKDRTLRSSGAFDPIVTRYLRSV